jgi:site-specific DNA-methyltransferase (adenine-specific)
MRWTTDVWDVPPEGATRVGHPAPFPVELPQRLIELYTFRGDLVLDPFMGSGSTAVAAIHTHRRFFGFDTDASYVQVARDRIQAAFEDRERRAAEPRTLWQYVPEASIDVEDDDFQRRAVREGRAAKEVARAVLENAGFVDIVTKRSTSVGVKVDLAARDRDHNEWYFDVSGAFSKGNERAGLRRTDTLYKALGRAAVLRPSLMPSDDDPYRLVLLTTDLPQRSSAGGLALKEARRSGLVFDAVEMLSPDGQERLARYATECPGQPLGELFA